MNDLSFLQQLISRLKAKSPTFFKVITWISATTAFITGLPELISTFGITLPPFLVAIENKTIAIAATVAMCISKLTVATPTATKQVLSDINSSGSSPLNTK